MPRCGLHRTTGALTGFSGFSLPKETHSECQVTKEEKNMRQWVILFRRLNVFPTLSPDSKTASLKAAGLNPFKSLLF